MLRKSMALLLGLVVFAWFAGPLYAKPAAKAAKKTTKKAAKLAKGIKEAKIRVIGMSCGGCVANIKRALGVFKGIKYVHVSLKHKQCDVRYNPKKVQPKQLVAAINKAGYTASLLAPKKKKAKKAKAKKTS